MSEKIKNSLLVVIFLLIWQLLVLFEVIDGTFFPAPLHILQVFIEQAQNAEFWTHIAKSLERLFNGFLIGWTLGMAMVFLSARYRFIQKGIAPFINFGYPLPKVALFPLFLVIFGLDEAPKIAMVAAGVFFLVYIPVLNSLLLLMSRPLMSVTRVYSVTGKRFWFDFILKGILVDTLVATKISLGYGFVLVVVGESKMSQQGIGFYLWQSWEQFKVTEIYVAILVIGLIGLLLNNLLDKMTTSLFSRYAT